MRSRLEGAVNSERAIRECDKVGMEAEDEDAENLYLLLFLSNLEV